MNKLQLVQQLARNSGDYRPIDRISYSGIIGSYAGWIDDAWRDLQSGGLWRWMRGTAVAFASEGQSRIHWSRCYDQDTGLRIPTFNQWRTEIEGGIDFPRYVRVDDADVGEDGQIANPLSALTKNYGLELVVPYATWDSWRAAYDLGQDFRGAPSLVSVSPNNDLVVGPRPSDGTHYRIRMDYFKGPNVLVEDDDEPELPQQFHMLIVYDALLHVGHDRARQELVDSSREFSSQMRSQLEAAQTEQVTFAGPLLI